MAVTNIISRACFEFGNRFDAELYRPELRESLKKISNSGFAVIALNKLCIIRSGTTPSDRIDELKHGPILFKTTDVRNNIIAPNGDYYHISEAIQHRMWKTRIQPHDVLLNIVGATLEVIGRTAFVDELLQEANITQAMVFLRCKSPDILPGYLFSYLNTNFAKDQVKRFARPTGQYNLNLNEVGKIQIPIIPIQNQREVESLILQSSQAQNESEKAYKQAKQILDFELGLNKLSFQKPMGYTAQFSELELSRRLDAQHYQAKFTQLLAHIAKFPNRKIRDIQTCNRRGIQPIYVNDGNFDVINSQHLGPKHINYDGLEKTSHRYFSASPVAHIRKNDLLIYTTGAYIGRTNVYLSDAPAFASNHVNILRITPDIDAAYMAMVFQSVVGQFQTQKHSRGSAQAELYPNDIDKFVVPILPFEQQKIIGDLVRESLVKQLESARLFEQAKTRVEQLIEAAVQS